ADLQTKVHGKDFLPMAGEYTGEAVLTGVAKWLAAMAPRIEKAGIDSGGIQRVLEAISATKQRAAELLGGTVPARPPGFCIGCPERSEERRVGKECRSRWGPYHEKKKKKEKSGAWTGTVIQMDRV